FFNQAGDVSLERLESMCVAIGLDFYDLVDLTRKDREAASLTEEQEQVLADPAVLAAFLAATMSLNRLQLKAFNTLSDVEIDSALRLLEQHGMAERHSHGRLKSRFAFFSLKWIPEGPFERRYSKEFRDDFFQQAFGAKDGFSDFRQIYLTRSSLETLSAKMNDLFNEAIAMSKADIKNDMFQMMAVGVLMSTAAWMPPLVRDLYKPSVECDSILREQRQQHSP
ncbi:MAG: hypothetical protein NTV34_04965, partial [Proteobacteria bacterium]|nr:hypothetical protein [Pseudomonadota bacterium]